MGLLNQTQKQYYSTASPSTFGNYQFVSLEDVINNFIVSYVGDDKIIPKINRNDIAFHAQRAMQELSYDTFKSIKSQEIVVPASLTMVLPQDYVNYVKVAWSDKGGVEHIVYPISVTGNPTSIIQDGENYTFNADGTLATNANSKTWDNFKSDEYASDDEDDYSYDTDRFDRNLGMRYGADPQYTQVNGYFFIDPKTGKIHFSSSISGKTIVLEYISDGLGTDAEMIIPKLAEDAMYKCIAHAVMSTRSNIQEYIVRRFQKDKFAAVRKAKLRLSNLKLGELTQILRGKSKIIKH
tara:strand:+ start:830 stop:1714 length:885 start_codon:yes stop_codon:yes gene_type:complete